ncbi:MAG: GxxExxY protein [bacterium]|nr:GxxExxY protein [bacterium]
MAYLIDKMDDINKLSGNVKHSAIVVHKILGPGFMEEVYQNALAIQLGKDGIKFEEKVVIDVRFHEYDVGRYILDFLVDDRIILELKTVKEINDNHLAQTLSYLKATRKKLGLILNFSKRILEIKRVVNKI